MTLPTGFSASSDLRASVPLWLSVYVVPRPPCIYFAAIDRAVVPGDEMTTGALAIKCTELATRMKNLARPGDVFVTYQMPDAAFLDYFEMMYGFRPIVLAPRIPYTDPNEPLSLYQRVLDDEELLQEIARLGREGGLRLEGFITHRLLHEIGERTGLPVLGMTREVVARGAVWNLNDKKIFEGVCAHLGIPTVPRSCHVQGWEAVVGQATEMFGHEASCILRRARAAGGLGNVRITIEEMQKAECDTVRSFLEKKIHNPVDRHGWSTDWVLIAPFHDFSDSPGTLFYVDDDGQVHFVAIADQIIDIVNMSFLGSQFPTSVDHALVEEMIVYGKRYAEHFARQGGRGFVNVDWIVVDGMIYAIESNARYGGNNHQIAIAAALGLLDQCYFSNDKLVLHEDTQFEEAAAFIKVAGIGWCPERREGVIITIPPSGMGKDRTMGYVVFAATHERVQELHQAMFAFGPKSFDRTTV